MTKPRAWRSPEKIKQCRPRPVTDAPMEIPDSKVGQLDALLHESGVLHLIDTELGNRPGPKGLPVRTVLVGLLLALHYHQSASLAVVCRVLLDELRAPARSWLGVPEGSRVDGHARIAFSRRIYRSFDRLTTVVDPHRCDRRSRLPAEEARVVAAAWEDADVERTRRRELLQEISDLDYKQQHRGVQGTHQGALLVDGSLACPAMPPALAHATTGLNDKAVRSLDDGTELSERIAGREPYFLKLKESADERGAIRLQCPASGPSPAVVCPRFNQVHRVPAPRPAVVDLTDKRATAAHSAAKPTVPIPQGERLRPLPQDELPRICQKPTITVRPGALGKLDKFRQDRHYLHPTWQDAYRPERANIEGLNGRAKSHGIDISDPTKRLAHGRVAQTILLALMICSINLHILFSWHQTTRTQATGTAHGVTALAGSASTPPDAAGLPPPIRPEICKTI
ncbi:hypothetical protein OG322_21995 [Streptomyces sp. NBC_01260]|uniref:hypothetical protein n=1 Tax=Streptomyces sp. NBC_01260 TaxID=2903801 RepID=UPI002E325288|nr:hypothetical protein [Streptomyces sp. NBC_01260]